MASDYIRRMLEEAQAGPSGAFSLDLSRVELVFAAGGQDWLHYWLRFACFYGADPIRIEWDGRKFALEFESDGPDPEELRSLLLHPRRGPRYLALGMLAASQQGFTKIELECPRGTLSLERRDEGRRSRDGRCRLRASRGRRQNWLGADDFAVPYWLNGKLQKPAPGRGLRLLVDGWAFAWQGPPLLPPGESLDWAAEPVVLDALLLNPRLQTEQIQELQSHFRDQLLTRSDWTPESVEWLLLRDLKLARQLPAPPENHYLYPAYCERRAWLTNSTLAHDLWVGWPEYRWPVMLDQGLAPDLPEWLRPTCRRLPGGTIYRYLLRSGWLGEHRDPQLLTALLFDRQDTLGGHVLLARQLSFLRPAQRPDEAWRFCRDFLRATLEGQESQEIWAGLSSQERSDVRECYGKICELT